MKFHIAGAIGALTLAVAGLAGSVSPAQALGNPIVIRNAGVTQVSSNHVVAGSTFTFQTPEGNDPPAGYSAHIDVFSCGGFLQSGNVNFAEHPGVAVWFSPSGDPDFTPNSVNSRVGPSIQYNVIVTQPDGGTYAINGEVNGLNNRPSCDQILHGGSTGGSHGKVVVKKWSHKQGKAVAGHVLSVSKTKVPNGEKVTYLWRINGSLVSKTRTVHLPGNSAGKKVAVKVTVKNDGKSKSRTINYGRIAR